MKRFFILFLLLLLIVQVPLIAAAEGESELALKQVAQRYKSSRIIGSSLLIGVGGFLALSESEGSEDEAKLAGGVLAGAGLLTLLIKGPAEREYAQVVKVEDPARREAMAYESLAYLADTAKRNRIVNAIANGALSVYYLTSEPSVTYNDVYDDNYYTYMAILFGGYSLHSLFFRSYEEKTFERVKSAKERNYALGICPVSDSLGVRLTYNFK